MAKNARSSTEQFLVGKLLEVGALGPLQDAEEDIPRQPCGETFETPGEIEIEIEGELSLQTAWILILDAFRDAFEAAQRFCRFLGEEGCKSVEFVRYTFFDSDVSSTPMETRSRR